MHSIAKGGSLEKKEEKNLRLAVFTPISTLSDASYNLHLRASQLEFFFLPSNAYGSQQYVPMLHEQLFLPVQICIFLSFYLAAVDERVGDRERKKERKKERKNERERKVIKTRSPNKSMICAQADLLGLSLDASFLLLST